MASPPRPFDVSAELKALRHERQNQDLPRLPPNATIRRRPLNHAPIADVRSSGAKAPKVVYVSRRTPAIAAVKRVKRYLTSIEKRALQNAGAAVTRKGGHGPRGAVEKANEALAKNKEEVLVKASGRAMAQALHVGEWFRTHEKDMLCNVEVRTGSVSTVDDIVEGRGDDENEDADAGKDDGEAAQAEEESLKPQYGDTTLELLGGVDTTMLGSAEQATSTGDSKAEGVDEKGGADTGMDDSLGKQSRRKRKKRKRQMYEADELPEARIRWVNTVEIAISLQA
jgi:ribonuclease P/MRP protein subunit POP7